MAIPNDAWVEAFTAATHARRKVYADNVINFIELLRWLQERGQVDPVDGGVSLTEQIHYPGNNTFTRYSGFQTLNVGKSDVLTTAAFPWANSAISIAIDGPTRRQTMGRNAVASFIRGKFENAESENMNQIATDVFSDGLADGGKQIDGLQVSLQDDPTTGVYGQIDRATNTWWQNAFIDPGALVTADNMQGFMNQLVLLTLRGKVRKGAHRWFLSTLNTGSAVTSYYESFWNSLTTIQRITTSEQGTSGFDGLAHAGPHGTITVVPEPNAPVDHGYLVLGDDIKWRPHTDANFSETEPVRSYDQDATVAFILLMAQMTAKRLSASGVITDTQA